MLYSLKRHFGRIPGTPFSLKSGEVVLVCPESLIPAWNSRSTCTLTYVSQNLSHENAATSKLANQTSAPPQSFDATHNSIVQSIILESHNVVPINPQRPYMTLDGTVWHKQLRLLYKTSLVSKHTRGRDSKRDTPIDDRQMTKKMLLVCHSTEDSIDSIDSIHIAHINPNDFLNFECSSW